MEIMHNGWIAEVSEERGKGLTPSEALTLIHLASGMTQKEIAKAIKLSPRSVRGSLERAYHRLGVTRATAAVAKAQAKGWIRYAGKLGMCLALATTLLTGTDDAMRRSGKTRIARKAEMVQMIA